MFHFLPIGTGEKIGTSLAFNFFHVLLDVSLSQSFGIGLILFSKNFNVGNIIKPKY